MELVAGDVVLIPTTGGVMMECDAVLVEGTAVVNESMLTGESVPVTKIPVPDEADSKFVYDLQRQHVVFCGTEVMQGKVQDGTHCRAVVIRTGFMTTKGELVRSILFPPPLDFKFHSDFLKSIYVFLSLGLVGMAYSLYQWIRLGVSTKKPHLDYFAVRGNTVYGETISPYWRWEARSRSRSQYPASHIISLPSPSFSLAVYESNTNVVSTYCPLASALRHFEHT